MPCLQLVLQNESEIAIIYKELNPGKSQRVAQAISDKHFLSLVLFFRSIPQWVYCSGRKIQTSKSRSLEHRGRKPLHPLFSSTHNSASSRQKDPLYRIRSINTEKKMMIARGKGGRGKAKWISGVGDTGFYLWNE